MATSSITKSFVIKTRTEARNFVKLFAESEKVQTLNEVKSSTVTLDKLKEIINGTKK